MGDTFCPASMCPLIAPEGSPWTGQKNSPCPQAHPLPGLPGGGCGWWQGFGGSGCDGCTAAVEQIMDVERSGRTLQVNAARRYSQTSEKTFDCPRIGDCQWQREAGEALCPPRLALSKGMDPRVCNY